MKLLFSPVNQFYLILLSDQPKILEGEKKNFSFLSLSKSFAKTPLHICYSASTQRAKHGVMLSHISEMERYYKQNNLTPQVLLLLDNALGHLDSLWDWRKNANISILPSNLSSSIQLMDQKVISTFEAYYCRQVFGQVIDDTTIHAISLDKL